MHQRLLAANNLTLAHIARGAPLAQTLTCIVNGIEDQNSEISGAIFLLDEDGNRLHLGAAPSLHQDYSRAIDDIATDVGVWADQHATDIMIQITAENVEAGQFWRSFCDLALQHGLYICSMIPIRSSTNRILGVFVAYSQKPDQASDKHRQAIVDVTALASIAIERNIDKAKIKKAEDNLLESETRMALAIEGSGAGIWDRNISTGEIHYSAGWKAILGYTDADITNRIEDSYTRVHPEDLASVQAIIQAHFDQKTESYAAEHRIRCKDGSYKWISSRGKVVSRDMEGQPLRMIGMTTDITAMRALSDRLQQNVDLITCLTNEIRGLVFQYRLLPNGDAFFSYVSEGIRDIYEVTPEQVADNVSLIHKVIHPDDFTNYCASLEASAASLMPWYHEYRVILPRQGLRWRHGDARPCRLQDGSILWHGFITDVTERKRREIELQEFATIDFLTQLPNRRYFMARMEEELARIQRVTGTHTAVLMCDLDHFKIINDSYGHAIGDLVLKHFATILRDKLRKNDTVGRVGGEEFAIVLSGADVTEANIFAKRVQQQMAETPLVKGNVAISVTVSIGIAVMNVTDTSADAPLSRSDMALYRAKENGRNRIEIAVD
ncbi:diguanylate cyclase [Candidatus Nitrotoga sp. 1052]|uniref:diguanylate cyclase n=1 Tax=Candidatus Nitrotoga sp. 1052 TaxID=2886964 RepID=UPI001EF4D80B|nr:diguanylate cyclase [Candidatus Nitrotoga sp. 1052]